LSLCLKAGSRLSDNSVGFFVALDFAPHFTAALRHLAKIPLPLASDSRYMLN
jgi:hypothetical protein